MATIDSNEQFVKQISDFIHLSETIGDSWCLKYLDKNDHSSHYLCRVSYISAKLQPSLDAVDVNDMDLEDDIEEDSSCVTFGNSTDLISLKLEHHIVYSASYSVPVLYFNCYHDNGQPLSLEELWETVPSMYQARLAGERWATLTQVQHPLLGFPCFQLHPCHTADLMKSLDVPPKSNYILSWLSAVGPVVHVNLSLDYIKALEKRLEIEDEKGLN